MVDEVRVIRLLRAASGAISGVRLEQAAASDRLADCSDLEEFVGQANCWLSAHQETP